MANGLIRFEFGTATSSVTLCKHSSVSGSRLDPAAPKGDPENANKAVDATKPVENERFRGASTIAADAET